MKIPKRLTHLAEPIEESVFPDPSELTESQISVQREMLETVERQIEDENLPEVRETLVRLQSLGYSESDSKKFIANALLREIHAMLSERRVFDREIYKSALQALPESAFN